MRSLTGKFLRVFAAGSAFAGVVGCYSETLQPLQQFITSAPVNNGVTVNFCTDPATPVSSNLKYLIILDHSGSNQLNYQMDPAGDGAPYVTGNPPQLVVSTSYATDPHGYSRYGGSATTSGVNTPGSLLNFLKNAPTSDPTRGYALIDFNSSVTTFPTNQMFTSDINTGDSGDFFQFVLKDSGQPTSGPTDGSDTDYIGALQIAYNVIHNDIGAAETCAAASPASAPTATCPTPGKQVSSTYVIVFMSDGSPIMGINGISYDPVTGQYDVATGGLQVNLEPEDQVLAQVASIVGLQSNTFYVDSINLFSIYYHIPTNIDNVAKQYLTDMAKVGNGTMYDLLSGGQINYAAFTPPQKLIKYTLADIFVTNPSVAWWSDGKLHADTDMDGLPDDVEVTLGSDPYNSDSDGNGVSDYVEYEMNNGAPCASKNAQGLCQKTGRINYQASGVACNGMGTITPPPLSSQARALSGRIAFADTDLDGLNDCEELLLTSGGWDNPDSNNDDIPDGLEFRNGIGFQLGTNPSVNTTGVDGMTVYQKIKTSLPATIPYYQILNPQPSVYALNQLSTSDIQDCYQLTVTNLPQIGNNNTVRVDVLEKSQLLQSRLLYRTGKKQFATGSSTLQFNDWTNPAEISAGTWGEWP